MDYIVRLDSIYKQFGSFQALSDVSVDFKPGVTGLLGPNGAGKSTIIKIVLGLLRATSGDAQVLGLDVRRDPKKIRMRVGYMPEDDCYIGGISGVESVRFGARMSGRSSIESLRRAHEILDFCGAGQERYRTVETFSTGMRQKAKFAQSIIHDPDFIILDEPTSGLDPEERQRMLTRISSLADAGKAILISTHILPDVQAVCDNVVIVVGGEVRISEKLSVLQKPTSQTYQISTLGSNVELVEKISSHDIQVEVVEDDKLAVHISDEQQAAQVWRWAAETNSAIRSMQPAQTSLEEIFVNAVRGANGSG